MFVLPLFQCHTNHFTDERPVKVFDILYLNGESLLGISVKGRKALLGEYLKEVKGRIEFGIQWKGTTAKDIRERMDEIMVSRGEGLVIKHPKSKYELNGRTSAWIKVCFTCTLLFKLLSPNFF